MKTWFAEFFEASTKMGIIVISKPPRCPKRDKVSILSRALAPQVLNAMVTFRNANIKRVYCHCSNTKFALLTVAMASMRVAITKTLSETLVSQPRVEIHPAQIFNELTP
jgi:hypothetical protein